jgi:hydroxypyruvate isomerase
VRFSVNISILFTEFPFLERFERVSRAGMSAVEFWWPPADAIADLEDAVRDAGVEVVLMNFDAGDMPGGERGFVGDPERQHRFRDNVPVALELAERLGCPRLNALVGHRREELTLEEQLETARVNIAWAAEEAAAIRASIMIEPVNTFENGPYLLPRTDAAADFIAGVGLPNVRLQYDLYNMQRMEGNLAATLRARIGEIGHIQIADSPDRHEPGTGELNYGYLLTLIDELGYDGWVGLEYRPSTGSSEESLAWLPREARA